MHSNEHLLLNPLNCLDSPSSSTEMSMPTTYHAKHILSDRICVCAMDNSQKPWKDRKGRGHILKGRCSFEVYQ